MAEPPHNRAMEQPLSIRADPAPTRPSPVRVVLVAAPVVLAAYTATLSITHGLGPLDTLGAAAANTLALVLFGIAAYRIVGEWIVGRRLALQIAGHVVTGGAFALFAYWLLVVLLGLVNGVSATEFDVRPFANRAMAWQLLQNVTTYGIVACLAHLHSRVAEPVARIHDSAPARNSDGDRPPSRYFIRIGDDLQPIDVDEIVSISGADDYAEVSTLAGRHLVRMTLAEFEKTLDPARFIRIHRSRIVSVARIARAEPAGGGRMLLHMEDGEMIQTSRAGSRLLRDLII